MRKSTFIIIISIVLITIGAGAYWLFFYTPAPAINNDDPSTATNNGFSPFGRNPVRTSTSTGNVSSSSTASTNNPNQGNSQFKPPQLRQLSLTPVAGMFASTTKIKLLTTTTSLTAGLKNSSTTIDQTIVRFVERGTGHVFQADDLSLDVEKISNTTLPKIYEAYWNKNLTALVVRYLKDNTDTVTNFYAEVRKVATSTASSTTPFETKGRYLSSNIDQIAVSPLGDKIFTWNIEGGNGIGYISSFDEKNKTKIIDTPLTQMNIDWPEVSTLTMTTRGSGFSSGHSYSIDAKTGAMKKILGGIKGLSVKMSRDAKNTIYSVGGKTISTNIFDINKSTSSEVIFNTLADKCVWSTIRKNELYCAVPNDIPEGTYPDDWYKGKISFVDKIWHLDTTTGEVHLIANLLNLSNKLIDATQLTLDPKENYLYFINKNDLTLWSVDLNQ